MCVLPSVPFKRDSFEKKMLIDRFGPFRRKRLFGGACSDPQQFSKLGMNL